jgi:hypothetical protein
MPLIDAPRDVVFVHGVQWVRDAALKGYSQPLQDLMQNQAPGVRFRFHEVLWSDVVEVDEQKMLAGEGLIKDILTGSYLDALFELLKLIGQKTEFTLKSKDEAFSTKLPNLIQGKGGFINKALSAILDLAFYFSAAYGPPVREKVRQTINSITPGLPPVLFGHSLGSVILLDIIREDAAKNALSVGGFVTAGSPIGLFQPGQDDPKFSSFDWVNCYDTDDLVGFWNPLRRKGYTSVMDQRIDTHEFPFYSHVKYWTNSFVARELVDMSLTA